MNSFIVVEVEVVRETRVCFIEGSIESKEDIFILDRPPEPFCEDVVHASTSTVHADFCLMLQDEGCQFTACELDALIRVPDVRRCHRECVLERLHTEVRFHGRRQSPGDDISAVPVEDRNEIGEAVFELHVRDVGSPDLIRTGDSKITEEIWVLLMCRIALAQSFLFLRIDGLNSHLAHETADVVTTDECLMILGKFNAHPAGTVEGTIGIDAINETLVPFIVRIRDRDVRETSS